MLESCFAIPEGGSYAEVKQAEKDAGMAKEDGRLTLEKKVTQQLINGTLPAFKGHRATVALPRKSAVPLHQCGPACSRLAPRTSAPTVQRSFVCRQWGETQSLVSCTLGTGRDEQIIDGLLPE